MLLRLSIKDFVLIEELDLDLESGFTAITGETGAGKSIILGAINLIIGGRGDPSVVRSGASKTEIFAEFEVSLAKEAKLYLGQNDLLDGDVCIVRRSVDSKGRSKAWINGTPVSMKQLKEVGELLLDLYGQHEHYSLLRPAVQRAILDRHAEAIELCELVSSSWKSWKETKELLDRALVDQENYAARSRHLESTLSDLSDLKFDIGEWSVTLDRHKVMANSNGLIQNLGAAFDLFSGPDSALLDQIRKVKSQISAATEYDSSLSDIGKEVESLDIQAQELQRSIRNYLDRIESDPRALEDLELRIAEVQRFSRKHNVKPEEIPAFFARVTEELDRLKSQSDLESLRQSEEEKKGEFDRVASQLSAVRRKAASQLGKLIEEKMQSLSLAGSKFKIELTPIDSPGPHGSERVSFQVSMNPGSPLNDLSQVASGGELSRISLAIQSVSVAHTSVSTMIFDEVDSGVGGAVAETVGRLLRSTGFERQTLCVTHLPQVAAAANQHWRVAKGKSKDTVLTEVSVLADSDRVEEVARMLGGLRITDEARAHASSLLRELNN